MIREEVSDAKKKSLSDELPREFRVGLRRVGDAADGKIPRKRDAAFRRVPRRADAAKNLPAECR